MWSSWRPVVGHCDGPRFGGFSGPAYGDVLPPNQDDTALTPNLASDSPKPAASYRSTDEGFASQALSPRAPPLSNEVCILEGGRTHPTWYPPV